MKRHLVKRGKMIGLADFMAVTGKGQQAIERWIDGSSNPGLGDVKLIQEVLARFEGEDSALASGTPMKARA